MIQELQSKFKYMYVGFNKAVKCHNYNTLSYTISCMNG